MIGDYGLAKGLAYRYDSHDDLEEQRFHALRMATIKGQKDAETKQLAQDLKFPTAVNKWDSQQIANWSKDFVTNGIGGFLRENPDYATDPVKSAQLQHLKDLLHNNPLVAKASRNDYARAKHLEWKSKTPNAANFPEDAMLDQQWQNYERTGSIDGNPENKIDFTFVDPDKLFDTDAHLTKLAQDLTLDNIHQDDLGQLIRITRKPSEKTLQGSAAALLSNNEVGQQYMKDWYRLPEEKKAFYKTPQNFVARRFEDKARIDVEHRDNNAYLDAIKRSGSGKEKAAGEDPYSDAVLSKFSGIVNSMKLEPDHRGNIIPVFHNASGNQFQVPADIADAIVLNEHGQFIPGNDTKLITKDRNGNIKVDDLDEGLRGDQSVYNGTAGTTVTVHPIKDERSGKFVPMGHVDVHYRLKADDFNKRTNNRYFKDTEGRWNDDANEKYKQVYSHKKEYANEKDKEGTDYIYIKASKAKDLHNEITHATVNKRANIKARGEEKHTIEYFNRATNKYETGTPQDAINAGYTPEEVYGATE